MKQIEFYEIEHITNVINILHKIISETTTKNLDKFKIVV